VKKIYTIVVLLAVVLSVPILADSIWKDESASPYSPQKVYKVGDVINVIILESSSAKNLAGSKADVSDNLGLSFTHSLQQLAPVIGRNVQVAGKFDNKYTGSGQTTRGSTVTARVAAWVTEVLPNNNLAIKGRHRVEVNDEMQEIIFTGIVRPKDISGANTVYSYQVASASLSIKGTGSVADTESPGWITRIFNWLF